ncbi:hypothetical protein [Arthrobacter sp. NPDC090010]|uniref:hypothetical protein n=1 Tax=Arthrobacter sp. NPDC090010 TaxID=3363942 RepID=UPI0037F9484C
MTEIEVIHTTKSTTIEVRSIELMRRHLRPFTRTEKQRGQTLHPLRLYPRAGVRSAIPDETHALDPEPYRRWWKVVIWTSPTTCFHVGHETLWFHDMEKAIRRAQEVVDKIRTSRLDPYGSPIEFIWEW